MTPAARVAAAIEILDLVLSGDPAERCLTTWARNNRFAGSKDRAAIRDHVFDALRCRESFARLGGSAGGRGLMIGACRAEGRDLAEVFSGIGHAPTPLSPEEEQALLGPVPEGVELLDWPEWLVPRLKDDLGADFGPVSLAQRERAPVFLRVNLAKCTREDAQAQLRCDDIDAEPHPAALSALKVTRGARKLRNARAYQEGSVELQDLASQIAIEALPLEGVSRVLDYCAGGGGKALALAAHAPHLKIDAHDIDAGRMKDLPVRAGRAGARINVLLPETVAGEWDMVLIDAPCSGSGTWRRTPDAKWALTPARLDELVRLQDRILREAQAYVGPGGYLVYMTCSLLKCENDQQAQKVSVNPEWEWIDHRQLTTQDGSDGFFYSIFKRVAE
ncbi:RsmB/NOP family class I SAM-dependent RNA methyltransferase [Thioclava sp. 'Guangxiensis']|uniref:RsmB/NOP family class I SAM-dependent RNA methyltransferase n=1 Tax=Thioclava sp. 'Guangxiensis' TaxID=3149044 RepID=UPI0038782C53